MSTATDRDAASIVRRAGLWAAGLRERGQIAEDGAGHLAQTLSDAVGERLDQPEDTLLVVMLCGPTAVGKSSLINTLAGAEISRPGYGATTSSAVVYVHQADDPIRLYAYSQGLAGRSGSDTTLIRHARDALLHTVLIDTPDIDSVRTQHQALTARLVHAADLVLFVTSPEKYKVLRSVRWVREQRGQRALAFVLNKWDRPGLGLQADRRALLEADFRASLAQEGFPDPLVFRVSALAEPTGLENDLPALRAWLEHGITQSTASTIRRRRLRAAWGRLAAAIEDATPLPLSAHPLLPSLLATLQAQGGLAEQAVVAEAALLEAPGLEDAGFPASPGLLGMTRRLGQLLAAAAGSARAGVASAVAAVRGGAGIPRPRAQAMAFGERPARALHEAGIEAAGDAIAQGMKLAAVRDAWLASFSGLEAHLSALPLEATGDLALRSGRLTARRILGTGLVYAVELLILAVLALAVERVGTGFVQGAYASGDLFVSVLMLVSILTIMGLTVGGLCFPPLRQRLRRTVGARARALVKDAVQDAEQVLRDQVAAVDRLSREGHALLTEIDAKVTDLAAEADDAAVQRLFAEPAPVPAEPARGGEGRPVFD